jgi:hypothetical protein
MGEDVAAAPQHLVVRVGNDHCGLQSATECHIIVLNKGHCSPKKASKCRIARGNFRSISEFIFAKQLQKPLA